MSISVRKEERTPHNRETTMGDVCSRQRCATGNEGITMKGIASALCSLETVS